MLKFIHSTMYGGKTLHNPSQEIYDRKQVKSFLLTRITKTYIIYAIS